MRKKAVYIEVAVAVLLVVEAFY
jgi:hypothetical protein